MTNNLNKAGIDLIKKYENCSLVPYQDIKGIWTIGYGHISDVTENSAPITQEQADKFLEDDLQVARNNIMLLINVDLTDNQYSALVSLVYNCGSAPLNGHLGRYLNSSNFAAAADEFLVWDHAGGRVVQGLLNRRNAERELFLT